MKYTTVIGLEIHLETKTKSKMFSNSPSTFDAAPNTRVTSLDLGEPGTLPTVNKEAIKKAIMMCSALNMKIDNVIRFDRKNYFYADLPKGYQITQQEYPIGSDGYVTIHMEDESERKIELERLHMEEDTAKQIHYPEYTLLDYNRAGTPLVEIVTKPVIRSGYEAMKYVEKIRAIAQYLGISDGKMEEGSLRCDVNISLMPEGSKVFGTKVEIKNLNSIANVRKAIEFEMIRQAEALDRGETILQETRRFDEASKGTVVMRLKTDAVDYKYFREDNILPITLSKKFVDEVIKNSPESPDTKYNRYTKEFGISHLDATKILENIDLCAYYDEVVKYTKQYKAAYNFIKGEISAYLNSKELSFKDFTFDKRVLGKLFNLLGTGEINNKTGREIFAALLEGKNLDDLLKANKDSGISDADLTKLINDILNENAQSIEDFKTGRDRAFGFLVGQVMKLSQGKADPRKANEILTSELKKR